MFKSSGGANLCAALLCSCSLLPMLFASAVGAENTSDASEMATIVHKANPTDTVLAAQPEPILAIMRDDQWVFLDVISTGCTKASDFSWYFKPELAHESIQDSDRESATATASTAASVGSITTSIVIYRIKPDRCRKLPMSMRFKLQLPPEVKLVNVRNPLVAEHTTRSRLR